MRSKITALLAVCLATLGVAAGLFAFPARADNPAGAKTLDDLWAMGYVIGARDSGDKSVNPLECTSYIVLSANGVPFPYGQEPFIELNVDPSHPGCVTPPEQIQANIDALIANWPSAPQPITTAAAPETTPTTAPAPSPSDAPPAAAPVSGGTETVTVTDPTLQAQIDALNAKIDALTSRVDKLAEANTASWTAFSDALTAGASAADAALAARSAGLNSLYGL